METKTTDSRKETRELIFEGLELFNVASSPDDFSSASAVKRAAFKVYSRDGKK